MPGMAALPAARAAVPVPVPVPPAVPCELAAWAVAVLTGRCRVAIPPGPRGRARGLTVAGAERRRQHPRNRRLPRVRAAWRRPGRRASPARSISPRLLIGALRDGNRAGIDEAAHALARQRHAE